MSDMMWLVLLGHLFGDYLFQSKVMALRKSEKCLAGIGFCTVHVFIYTACVLLFLQTSDPNVALGVFIPHWIIDHWSLASPWLKLIRGRTFMAAFTSKDQYREFDVAFTSLVYERVDFTMHLFCLWALIQFYILR